MRKKAARKNAFFVPLAACLGPPKSATRVVEFLQHAIPPGKTIRVFPLSNWTELDIWHYIMCENIPMVPLYFAKDRPVVSRHGTWIMVDDERLPLEPGETPQMRRCDFARSDAIH